MSDASSKEPAGTAVDAGRSRPHAPVWHTALLVALIVAVALAGTLLEHAAPASTPSRPGSRFGAYAPLLVVEWGLLAYVSRVGRPPGTLALLLGKRWGSVRRACGDLVVALAIFAIIEALEWGWARATGSGRAEAAAALLPRTAAERAAWMFVAASTAFCEEVTYRGYLRTQLAFFTRRTWIGIALQAVLFGVAHVDQGVAAASRVAAYGAILGVAADRRASLLPGAIAHVAVDALPGLLG